MPPSVGQMYPHFRSFIDVVNYKEVGLREGYFW